MKHEDALAQPIGSDIKPGAETRKWIGAARPFSQHVLGVLTGRIVLPVIEHDLKQVIILRAGCLLSISYALQIAVSVTVMIAEPIALLRQGPANTILILLFIFISDSIPLVIMTFLQEPLEHPRDIVGS